MVEQTPGMRDQMPQWTNQKRRTDLTTGGRTGASKDRVIERRGQRDIDAAALR